MKWLKAFGLIVIALVVATSVGNLCLAESALAGINAGLQALIEDGNLNSKEAYNLIYEGTRAIESGVGEEEEIEIFNEYHRLYDRTRALDSVNNACDDENQSVIVDDDKKYFFEKQYSTVIDYKNDFYERLEGEEDPYELAKEFFGKVKLIPDMTTIMLEREMDIEESVYYISEKTVELVNDSLEKRGFNNRFEAKGTAEGLTDEFYVWYEEVLNSTFFSADVAVIVQEHKETISAIIDLPEESLKEDYLSLANEFVDNLSNYTQRTATFEDGLKAVALTNAIDALDNLLLDSKSQKATYQKQVKEIVAVAREKLGNAKTPQEMSKIVSDAQTEISKIQIKDYRWIWLLVLAVVIFIGSGVGAAFFFKAKARRKGVMKYKALLEDERERMEREINAALNVKEESDVLDLPEEALKEEAEEITSSAYGDFNYKPLENDILITDKEPKNDE